ncbi:MAG: MmgE/PrpD family protein [Burkholderiales bacterium]|nr:MmgE/PrpD family protein [Burkholderiales bacterium]
MSLAVAIASQAAALDVAHMPAEAVDWAKVAIIDAIGCALAGAGEDASKIALRVCLAPGGGGAATCAALGVAERLPALDAAFVNGVSGHALDFDDTSKSMAGHPTVVILPALLAAAEEVGASGRDLVEAYVTGLEAATRIARGVNFHHYEKGWHPTATLGIFGAAAACSRLLALDIPRAAHALGICVSLASGVKSNFGSPTKPLHAGAASRNGLLAAKLAQQGFTASADAFEHPQGFLAVFNGEGNFDSGRIVSGWGQPLDLLDPGISIKKYPCVYSIHAAIDCAISLQQKHRFPSDSIRRVVVTMHRRRLLPHVQRDAQSPLSAKFSLAYGVARGLADGRVSIAHFEGEAHRDPAIRRVMGLVATQAHSDDANDYAATVQVDLADGRSLTESVHAPLGSGVRSPLPDYMLKAKFQDCAGRVLAPAQAQSLFELLRGLEALPDVRALTRLAQPQESA